MTISFIQKARQSLLIGLGLLVAVVSTLAILPAQPTSAVACRYYWTSTPTWNRAPAGGEYGIWTFGDKKTTLSSSGCRDINLARGSIHALDGGHAACANFRIRYINSNGTLGAASQPTVFACTGSGNVVIKYGVSNGRDYRVETDQPVSFQIHD